MIANEIFKQNLGPMIPYKNTISAINIIAENRTIKNDKN